MLELPFDKLFIKGIRYLGNRLLKLEKQIRQFSRAYTERGGCKGGSSPHIPVKGGAPPRTQRYITLLKSEV